jgi:hypothetical protein
MKEPNYLVQTSDGVLHGYFDKVLLRIDLRVNGAEGVKLFALQPGWVVRYAPVTAASVLSDE